MTFPSQTDVVVGAVPTQTDDRSYVDWPAIVAGIALASAISIVLLAFGSAVGEQSRPFAYAGRRPPALLSSTLDVIPAKAGIHVSASAG